MFARNSPTISWQPSFSAAETIKTVYADSVKVESGLPGYRVVIKSEAFEYGANFRVYGLEKIRGLSILVY